MQPTTTVIIAEDDHLLRSITAVALRHLRPHLHIFEAADGHVALELYHRHGADLLITDDQMPRICGGDLVQALRGEDVGLRILMMSGNEQAQKQLPQDDHSLFVPKPVSMPTLLGLVDQLLARQ